MRLSSGNVQIFRPFHGFDLDQLAKIHRHRWKERLKINKFSKFESDMFKTNESMHPQRHEILQTLVWYKRL